MLVRDPQWQQSPLLLLPIPFFQPLDSAPRRLTTARGELGVYRHNLLLSSSLGLSLVVVFVGVSSSGVSGAQVSFLHHNEDSPTCRSPGL